MQRWCFFLYVAFHQTKQIKWQIPCTHHRWAEVTDIVN